METAKKRILVCTFHQESDTFNPIVANINEFHAGTYREGQDAYDKAMAVPCMLHGIVDAIEEADGIALPSIHLSAASGGRVDDQVYQLLLDRIDHYLTEYASVDAICCDLHGATCTETHDDGCGDFLEYLRTKVGNIPIAAAFDLHANITEKILQHADIVCGYQTYPHADFYETGYRAAKFLMKLLHGAAIRMAAVRIPMMVPPAGYTSAEEPFKSVIGRGHELVNQGQLLDFTVFPVQPWLDIPCIASTVVTIAEEADPAKESAQELAAELYAGREGYWPELLSIDEILDKALANTTGKPVILSDAADSPNGGAVGDSVAVALRIMERGLDLRTAMFVKDPEAAAKAFEVGVGNSAEFTIGAKYTPDMPGPLKAVGTVRSLHDGYFRCEAPASRGALRCLGRSAVVSIGSMDILLCETPGATGDPQIFRHFGLEPILYDLVVVKANTSFRLPYSQFAGEICCADSPGAGSSRLTSFNWKHLPKGFYPFDLPEDYKVEKATIWT